MQSVLAVECFCLSCLSINAPYLSNQPQILCEWAFLLPMLCTEVPSFFSPCVCLPVVPSYLPSNLSCRHTSASSKCEHTGGFCLPLQFGWGSCPIFWGGRAQRHPLYPTSSAYILLSCLLSLNQCVGHLWSDLSVWGDGVLQPCPFPWCVVVCFNGDLSLLLFACLCISAAAYTCLRGALLAGGPLLAH